MRSKNSAVEDYMTAHLGQVTVRRAAEIMRVRQRVVSSLVDTGKLKVVGTIRDFGPSPTRFVDLADVKLLLGEQ